MDGLESSHAREEVAFDLPCSNEERFCILKIYFCKQFFFFLGFLIFRGNFDSFPGSKFIEAQKRGLIRSQFPAVLTSCHPTWPPYTSVIAGGYLIAYGYAELTGRVSL